MPNRQTTARPARAEIVQFDEALLAACGPALREELLVEAAMLAEVFAPEGRSEQLLAMAATLASGARGQERNGVRARRLACALRCLARHGR